LNDIERPRWGEEGKTGREMEEDRDRETYKRSELFWTDHIRPKFIPKYPVRSVSGRKIIVTIVKRRIVSFISYDFIYKRETQLMSTPRSVPREHPH
jgi:hypothetical protein